jgi:hypothetical protein
MEAFKLWYMARYWEFDDLFLQGAEMIGITYHEFVLISLCVVWPTVTLALVASTMFFWSANRRLRKESGS